MSACTLINTDQQPAQRESRIARDAAVVATDPQPVCPAPRFDLVAAVQQLEARRRRLPSGDEVVCMIAEISTDEMMAELTITFPALWKRKLCEFFGAASGDMLGVWSVAAAEHVMPDGEPIFRTPPANAGFWLDRVHVGFEGWLANRGWAWSCFDDYTFWLVPLSAYYQPWVRNPEAIQTKAPTSR